MITLSRRFHLISFWFAVAYLGVMGVTEIFAGVGPFVIVSRIAAPRGKTFASFRWTAEHLACMTHVSPDEVYRRLFWTAGFGSLLILLSIIAGLRYRWSRSVVLSTLTVLTVPYLLSGVHLLWQHGGTVLDRVLTPLEILVPPLVLLAFPRTWAVVTKNAGTVTDVTA